MSSGFSKCIVLYVGISSSCWRGVYPAFASSGDRSRSTRKFASTPSSAPRTRHALWRHFSSSNRDSADSSVGSTDESFFDDQTKNALVAVRKACDVTTKLQSVVLSSKSSSITKADDSPVTIADFASQATILQFLHGVYPDDAFLAEESSENLTPKLTERVQEASGISSEAELKRCIDLGKTAFEAGVSTSSRFWCLDPIDGTKGFLRNDQYCIALALMENGVPMMGVLACPRLPQGQDSDEIGCIFLALRGQGCYELPIKPGVHPPIRLPLRPSNTPCDDASKARFCVGVEQGFADPHGRCKAMASLLHGRLDNDGEILHARRMDSQAKYGVVARGDAEFYVRLPQGDHRDWIWDVAPGILVLEEVGGLVTDSQGRPLDFSAGSKLTSNGILGASSPKLHASLLKAYKQSAP